MTPNAKTHAAICRAIRRFDWGDYGMHDAELGIREDLKAQEWIPDLASKILGCIDAL